MAEKKSPMKIRKDVYKLTFVHTKYYIDEESRTVKAKVFVRFPELFANNHVAKSNNNIHDMVASFKKYPKSFIGKAVCSPNDVFDIEKGKNIARARADKAAYIAFKDYMNDCQYFYMDIFCKFYRTTQKAIDLIWKKKDYINKLTKDI